MINWKKQVGKYKFVSGTYGNISFMECVFVSKKKAGSSCGGTVRRMQIVLRRHC